MPAHQTGDKHMRGRIAAVLLGCVCIEPSLADTSPQSSSVADSLRQRVQDWEDATQAGDVDKVGKIEADDWRSVNLDGSVSTKQDDLSGLKSGKVKHIPLEMGPSDVKMLSDTIAVVQSTATDRRTMGGAGPATTYAFTDVFVKGADGWRVVRSQATKLK
jgi:ketosteroid isomerase-like protein